MRLPLLSAALVVAIQAAPALAQGPVRYAVTPLDGLGVDAALLKRLDQALARQLVALDIATVEAKDEAPCDGETACLAALGKKLGASRVIAGSVGLAGDQLHIALKVVTSESGDEARSIDEAAPIDQAEVRLRATATKLLAPDKYNTSGSIVVVFPAAGAEVIVDGRTRARTPLFGPIAGLPPGRRDVEVRYPGAAPWRAFVDLRYGEPHRIELALVDGKLVEAAAGGASEPKPAAQAPNVLLLSGIGVTALGVASGVGAIVAYNATVDAHQRAFTGGGNAEETAQAVADYRAAYALCGTLTAVTAVALATGGGVIAFSLLE